MVFVNVTYGSQAHPTGLHSHHNHHRHTAEGCIVRYYICTHHLYKVHVWGFGLKGEKHINSGDQQNIQIQKYNNRILA